MAEDPLCSNYLSFCTRSILFPIADSPSDFAAAVSRANVAPAAPVRDQDSFEEMIPAPARPFLAVRATPTLARVKAESPGPCLELTSEIPVRGLAPVQIDAPDIRRSRASTAFPKHDR